jgi:hypothetical protein
LVLLFSDFIKDFLKDERENRKIRLIFELYPLLSTDILEIESTNQTELFFTEEQISYINQFKSIQFIPGKADNFRINRMSFEENYLFIFIPKLLHHLYQNVSTNFRIFKIF